MSSSSTVHALTSKVAPDPSNQNNPFFSSSSSSSTSSRSRSLDDEEKDWDEALASDKVTREAIKARVLSNSDVYTAEENMCFDLVMKMEARVDTAAAPAAAAAGVKVKAIATRYSMLQALSATADGITHGRSYCRVRASVEDVLAFLLDNDAKIKTKYDVGKSTIEQKTLEVVNEHHSVIYLLGRSIPPFQNREFVGRVMWRKESDKNNYFYIYVPTMHPKAPLSSNSVRAEAVRAFRLSEESPGVTKVTYTFTMDLKGLFPESISNRIVVPSNLESPYRPLKYFVFVKPPTSFDFEDAATLAQLLTDDITSCASDAQNAAILRQYAVRCAAIRHAVSQLPWLLSLVCSFFLFSTDARRRAPLRSDEATPNATGERSSTAPLQSQLDVGSSLSTLSRLLTEKTEKKKKVQIALADFTISHAEEAGSALAICASVHYTSTAAVGAWMNELPAMRQLVVENFPFLYPFFVRLAQGQVDRTLRLTESQIAKFTVDATLGDTSFVESLAELLMSRSGGPSEHMVSAAYRYNDSRLEATFPYPLMPFLLAGMIYSGISSSAKSFTKPLATLTPFEAYSIGKSLGVTLASEQTYDGAVDLWLGQYVSLQELAEETPHFKNLAVVIARRLLMQAPWGLVFRVWFGTAISVADLVTDIMTISMFYREGRIWFAVSTMCMIGLCLAFQLLVVYLQNRRRGLKRLLTESALVLSFLKPGVDAYRVCSGDEHHPDDGFDPFLEMILNKIAEILGEAIPAAALQTYAFIISDRASITPLFSIATSILSIAYSSSMVSLDKDCNPVGRRSTPQYYGYVPNRATLRLLVFATMVMFSVLHITMKVLGVALLATLGSATVCSILVGDLLLFCSYKVFRKDWVYWLPFHGLFAVVIATILFRVCGKIISDFTAVIVTRHPCELGGLYWSVNLILAHATAFLAVYLYSSTPSSNSIDSFSLWSLMAILEGSFLLVFAIFLRSINPSFIPTFFNTMTGPEFTYDCFRRATSDEARFHTFKRHASYYASFKDELRVWLSSNWTRWTVDEKPAWFNHRILGSIPDDLLPKIVTQETLALRRETISKRNRSRMGLLSSRELEE